MYTLFLLSFILSIYGDKERGFKATGSLKQQFNIRNNFMQTLLFLVSNQSLKATQPFSTHDADTFSKLAFPLSRSHLETCFLVCSNY